MRLGAPILTLACCWVLQAQVIPPLRVSPAQFAFVATAQAEAPPPQILTITSTDGSPFDFQIEADSGQPGTPPPAWLNLGVKRGSVPARVHISVSTAGLQPGDYEPARLLINSSRGHLVAGPIPVTLKVVERAAALAVEPGALRFHGRGGGPLVLEQPLLVRNLGSGGLKSENISLTASQPWLRAAVEACAEDCMVRVTAAIQGLTPGSYRAVLKVATGLGSREIPVALHLADRGPWLELSPAAVHFEARAGQGSAQQHAVSVLNAGEGALTWTAEIMAGRQWLWLDESSGVAAAGSPGRVRLRANPATLAPGTHYALVRISSPEAPNSPVHLIGILSLEAADTASVPLFSEAGHLFVTQAGAPSPDTQRLTLMTSSSAPVLYQAAPQMLEGTSWLSLTPARGELSSAAPATVLVGVAGGLPPGVYRGNAVISIGGTSPRAAAVALVIRPPEPEKCSPGSLLVLPLMPPDGFEVRSGIPVQLAARVVDACGDTAQDALVMATFSNGDPAVALAHAGNGIFRGVWVPGAASASMSLRLRAWSTQRSGLQPGRWDLVGAVLDHRAPTLTPLGVLDNLNPQIGARLAPGSIVQIYGSNLARAPAQTALVAGRLPTEHDGVSVLVGGLRAPLYFLSGGQINAQIPVELLAGRRYELIVSRDGAFTLPEPVDLSAARPAIAAIGDGRAIAQDSGYRLIDRANPARPGDYVVIYLSGMGLTNPMVGSGLPAPRAPLAHCVYPPQVTLDGRPVEVIFAGLTPDAVGLYQINFRVPPDARPGDLKLVVIQEGARSNEVILPVQSP